MRVLHVITSIARGGAEHHLLMLASGLAARGHQVAVAALKPPAELECDFAAAGVTTHALGLGRYGELAPAWRLRRLVAGFVPDVVHAHLPPAELYTRLALLGSATRLVITRHNDERFAPVAIERALSRWCARRAGRVIAISDAVARWSTTAPQGPGLAAARVAVIRYALAPPPAMQPAPDLQGVGRLVVCIARLVPQKGLDVLLDAFATLPPPDRLVIVGEGGLRSALDARITRLGLAGRVRLAGARADVPAVLAAADLFVLPSRWEGFGLVLLEAMAAGTPIVATRVSAIPEVLGDCGVLVPPDDAPALARAMAALLADAPRRAALAQAGQARLRTRFDPAPMIAATEALYGEIAQPRRAGLEAQPAAMPPQRSTG
jgi:glycosyltransferase involved in cell wall biosynthesis